MPPATYGITPSGSQYANNLSGLWRKVQGELREATNFMFPEWDELQKLQNFNIDWSAREITSPFDLQEGAGVASLTEGGWEARPSSPTVIEGTYSWIHLNKRFTVSKISKMIQQKNAGAMIASQMVYQGKKAVEALKTYIADSFYGFSTGIRGKVVSSTGTTTAVITIKDAYGIADLGSTGAPAWVSTLFRPQEWIALIRTGALVANSFGRITAVDVNAPSITVVFDVAPTIQANDSIVFANSLENTTLDGTDYNKSLTGLLDMLTSVSLQGISSATYPKWAPAYTNTTAGRFNAIKLRRIKQGVSNSSGGSLTTIRTSDGVINDVFSQLSAGVAFPGMNNLELDGDVKMKGVDLQSSRHVPPGMVFGWDKKVLRKMVLLTSDPKAPTWEDGEKIPDRSGYVFPIDYPCQMVCLNRSGLAFESNKTEM
jgi:hypothetical protein